MVTRLHDASVYDAIAWRVTMNVTPFGPAVNV
jgi:hypothetical protein